MGIQAGLVLQLPTMGTLSGQRDSDPLGREELPGTGSVPRARHRCHRGCQCKHGNDIHETRKLFGWWDHGLTRVSKDD